MNFAIIADHRMKRKQKGRQVLKPCQTNKKVMEHEDDDDSNCNSFTQNDS